jgi:hypothetical protein
MDLLAPLCPCIKSVRRSIHIKVAIPFDCPGILPQVAETNPPQSMDADGE